MKNINVALTTLLLLTGCSKNVDEIYTPTQMNVEYEAVKPFNTITVNVPQGKTAYILGDAGDTIAVTSVDGAQVKVPSIQNNEGSRAGGYTINYDVNTGDAIEYTSNVYYVLVFEDSKNGDYDYNDVILHVAERIESGKGFGFFIQPVAFGASKTLKFGVDLYFTKDGNTVSKSFTFSNDLRKDTNFFGEMNQDGGFVNTGSDKNDFYRFKIGNKLPLNDDKVSAWINDNGIKVATDVVGQIWWIEDESGTRYYSVPSERINNKSWTDDKGYPYGLVLTHLNNSIFKSDKGDACGADWFNYPLETVSIQKAFPSFDGWLKGEATIDWMNPVEGTTVDAIGPAGNDGSIKASNPYSLFMYEGQTWNTYTLGNYGSGYIYRK